MTKINTYEFAFSAKCPMDGERIKYKAVINVGEDILAEKILEAVDGRSPATQESIADALLKAFGGEQVIIGTHKSGRVKITTIRG